MVIGICLSNAVGIATGTQTDIAPKTEFETRWVEASLFQHEQKACQNA
jgi:hypothetical protein